MRVVATKKFGPKSIFSVLQGFSHTISDGELTEDMSLSVYTVSYGHDYFGEINCQCHKWIKKLAEEVLPSREVVVNDILPNREVAVDDGLPLPSEELIGDDVLPSEETVVNKVLPKEKAVVKDVLPSEETVVDKKLPKEKVVVKDVLPSEEAVFEKVLPIEEADEILPSEDAVVKEMISSDELVVESCREVLFDDAIRDKVQFQRPKNFKTVPILECVKILAVVKLMPVDKHLNYNNEILQKSDKFFFIELYRTKNV